MKLSYNKFRDIMCLAVENETLSARIENILDGKIQKMSKISFLKLLKKSNVDKDIYKIITGEEAGKADVFKVLKVLFDFFGWLLSNSENWKGLLGSLGLGVEKVSTILTNVSKKP